MKFGVDLAAPFHYSVGYLVIVTLLFLGSLGFLIWVLLKNRKKQDKVEVVEKRPAPLDLAMIKKKYLMRLDELSKRIDKNKPRSGYQELSFLLRSFVFEATGVKVTKYTLKEIDRKSFPVLYEIIEEFYSPEFSRESAGDLMAAVEKVRKGIESWK